MIPTTMKMTMRGCMPLLTLLLQVYPVCMDGQTDRPSPVSHEKLKIHDPGIPGIQLIGHDDPEFKSLGDPFTTDETIFIRNTSKKTVTGLATEFVLSGRLYDTIIDGIGNDFDGLKPMGVATAAPHYLKAENVVVNVGGGDEVAEHFTIAWLLFDDGSFYGQPAKAEELTNKAKYRLKALMELRDAASPEAEIERFEKCATSPGCAPISATERRVKRDVIDDYRVVSMVGGGAGAARKFLDDYIAVAKRFKAIKTFTTIPVLVPENATDGWRIASIHGTCANASLPYNIISYVNGCTYPLDGLSAGTGGAFPFITPKGIYNLPSPTGFYWQYGASCTNDNPPRQLTKPNSYLSDGQSIGKIPPGMDPFQAFYAPPFDIFVNITTDYQDALENVPDTAIGNAIVGIPQAQSDFASVNGVTANCTVSWFTKLGVPVQVDALGTLPNGTLFSRTTSNNFISTWNPPFGYIITNRKISKSCNPTIPTTELSYPAVRAPAGPYGAVELVACAPSEPMAGGGGQSCDPSSYCCCVAGGVSSFTCALLDPLGEDPACSGGVAEAIGVESSNGMTVPEFGATQSSTVNDTTLQSQIGINRNGTFLLDSLSTNQLISGQTASMSFAPPGGMLQGDVPVSGDWAGNGNSCLGYYRPGTGQWFLDANCNGVWDAGIDYLYAFGGLQSSGTPHTSGWTPGDVPVVGNWNGSGRSCIGLFRAGFLWVIDNNCDGTFNLGDVTFGFGGEPGDIPVVGHWIAPPGANGIADQVGVVRAYNISGYGANSYPYYWILDGTYALDPLQANHVPGRGGTGCATYDIACLTPAPFGFGGVGSYYTYGYGPYTLSSAIYDQFVVGDWTGGGISHAGVYRIGTWLEDMDGSHAYQGFYQFGGLVSYGSYLPYNNVISNYIDDKALVGKW